MALLQDLVDRYIWPVKRRVEFPASWSAFASDDFTDESVTKDSALKIATFFTCVNVIAQTIGALPGHMYKESGSTKEVLTNRTDYLLAHQPNEYLSSANMMMSAMIHLFVKGNAFIRIYRDFKEDPESFQLILPWEVSIQYVEGDLYYTHNGEAIPARDMLHYRLFSWDGVCGIDPIRMHANTLGMAMRADRFAAMGMAINPPGFLSYQGQLNSEQMKQNKENWKKDAKAGNVAIMTGNWTYSQLMQSAGEAQLAELKKMTKQDIYGIMRIPPTFAQDFERATYTNAEQSDLVFAKHTITPICVMIEKENNMKLVSESQKKNTYWKYNLNGLLRGDLAARQSFYQAMKNNGLMNANEIRNLEDLNGYGVDGDMFTIQGAQMPVDQLRAFYESKMIPKETTPIAEPPRKINGQLNGHHAN